jgi:hypothetical protein
MVQQPQISGNGIQRQIDAQGIRLDCNYINSLVKRMHAERAKRASAWMLNLGLASFEDAMSEIVRLGWQIGMAKWLPDVTALPHSRKSVKPITPSLKLFSTPAFSKASSARSTRRSATLR